MRNEDTISVTAFGQNNQEADELTLAYAALGKAFYENRFEEPTPELLPYFDRITILMNNPSILKSASPDDLQSIPKHEDAPVFSRLEDLPDLTKEAPAAPAPSSSQGERRFCPSCGAPFIFGEELFCGNCGSKLPH